MTTRKRKTSPKKMSLSDYIYKHSPIKRGLVVKNQDKPLTKYNKIKNRIYLGNYQAAKNKDFFKEHNITAVLNCSKDLPNYFHGNKDIEYMRIPVDDSLKQRDFDLMYQFMPAAVEFIHKHSNVQKGNILIHCYAGRQRSAICLAAFMVSKYKMTPAEACKMVLDKRPEAFHFGQSLNFDQTLNKYYKTSR
jgi:protein-tyrosine phosphatase